MEMRKNKNAFTLNTKVHLPISGAQYNNFSKHCSTNSFFLYLHLLENSLQYVDEISGLVPSHLHLASLLEAMELRFYHTISTKGEIILHEMINFLSPSANHNYFML